MKTFRFGVYSLVLPAAVFAASAIHTFAQEEINPIKWTIKNETARVKAGDKFNVQAIAQIDEGWHLYSLDQPSGGPIPTRISIPENQKFKLAGEIESPMPQVVFDPNFNINTQFYEQEAVFTLPVAAVKDAAIGKNTLVVSAFFQTCNDKVCLPPKSVKLATDIEVGGATAAAISLNAVSNVKISETKTAATTGANSDAVNFDFTDFAGKPRKFSEFRGKYVLLDFWATWCRPCLADIPKLKELYAKHKANGFEIIGMDSETIGDESDAPDPEFAKETAERAKQIVTTRGVTWTQATSETAVPIAVKVFGVKALPTKILIDKEGKIIATIGEKDDLTGIVEKLLSEAK